MKVTKKEFKLDLAKDPLDSVVFDSNYEYKWVIFTYTTGEIAKRGTKRVSYYESKGWEVVYGTEASKSLTTKTSDETEQKLAPIIEEKPPVHKAVLMRCLKTRRVENEKAKTVANNQRWQRQYSRVERQGQNTVYTDSHIDINDLKNTGTDINDLGD